MVGYQTLCQCHVYLVSSADGACGRSEKKSKWNHGSYRQVGVKFKDFSRPSKRLSYCFLKMGAQWLSGRVLDLSQGAAGSSLTGVTVLCP